MPTSSTAALVVGRWCVQCQGSFGFGYCQIRYCSLPNTASRTMHGIACHTFAISFLHFHFRAGLQAFVPTTANLQRALVTRTPLWPQHWSLLSAVSTDSKITVSHVLTDGASSGGTLFVLGDASGRLYFFTAAGHLLREHDTGDDF
eukprot:GHRQ01030853.1.p1 GENE.GHRQ01030853.1~~GHRQ01030853.1.p1  ORF type:complete len:146 (-),score=18.24 GHRQ01030853.1:11-448(-)